MVFGGGKDFIGLLKERSEIVVCLWDVNIKVRLLLFLLIMFIIVVVD